MNSTTLDDGTPQRLADLWNRRQDLSKAEMVEFYEVLTGQVWRRVNIASICRALMTEPADARHTCFIEKVLKPARRTGTDESPLTAERAAGFFTLMLKNFLQDELRRQNVDRGGGGQGQVVSLSDDAVAESMAGPGAANAEVELPVLGAEFARRLQVEILPLVEEFVRSLERDDRILLKCWYGKKPPPALSWFKSVMPYPDFRARRLGLNPCKTDYLDYEKTRVGKWARSLQLSLSRDRYEEILVILEMLRIVASRDETIDCAQLPLGPPPPASGAGRAAD